METHISTPTHTSIKDTQVDTTSHQRHDGALCIDIDATLYKVCPLGLFRSALPGENASLGANSFFEGDPFSEVEGYFSLSKWRKINKAIQFPKY